ncbi:heavy metal translocating P-type ATPase [Brachybacterium sp. Marseille-Q2903]|uniref:Heavy metal translocating P-type ATPase n=1 Tax=Brachybacterium epidermidis TaxID=2781983 RepID=A0ABR9VXV6_9MICO|nr:heavy metal translocating P-type ATPase [Brachybacterium epidermidis]
MSTPHHHRHDHPVTPEPDHAGHDMAQHWHHRGTGLHGPADAPPGGDRHGGYDAEQRAHEGHALPTATHTGHDMTGHGEHDMAGHEHHDPHAGHDMSGHGGHAGHGDHVGMFRRLFWIMLVLAIPTVLLNGMFADLLGYALPDAAWVRWVSPVLGTVMYLWGGKPFLTGAIEEIRDRKPGMMLLIGMAITVAFVSSLGASLGLLSHELDFWWELALLIVIMLLGHWLEMRSLAQTSSALDSLAALLPDQAEKIEGEDIVAVSPAELQLGDVVIVRPGGRVPADGEVIDGGADVDESMITGESSPVRREIGDQVVAGTVATDNALRVRVTAIGEDTALSGIQRLVANAQSSTTRAQLLADRAAGWLFWYALIAAIVTAIVWTVVGVPESALVRAITVLVIACPHALGLAIPLVVSISTERAAKGGVLVKERAALERMRTIDTVLFDKTGTLTKGEPALNHVTTVGTLGEDELLALAAAAEADSEHPLARAIAAAADDRRLDVPRATEFQSTTAVGVSATVDGRTVQVGGPNLLAEHGHQPLPATGPWSADGAIVLHVLLDGQVTGAIGLADEVRQESREAVDALHELGIRVVMITGDAQPVARAVAGELGIDQVFAQVRPEHKSEKVLELQRDGRAVAMVGDGVNDAPALAQADVGIAIGAGTDVAIASAGVILASDDPRSVLSVIQLSRASYRKMKQNLWWAAGYNIAAVPLAAGVLAPIGFVLPMSVGAILMSLSTVVVALNAQMLRRLDLTPAKSAARLAGRESSTSVSTTQSSSRAGSASSRSDSSRTSTAPRNGDQTGAHEE